jgi:hypothetical protein
MPSFVALSYSNYHKDLVWQKFRQKNILQWTDLIQVEEGCTQPSYRRSPDAVKKLREKLREEKIVFFINNIP